MGDPAIFAGRLILIMCYHSTEINAIPPPCLYLKQCVRIRSVNRKNNLGGWLHFIINLQPLIPNKVNVFCLIGGVENASLDSFPWVRWWGRQILDLWWIRVGLFLKEPSSSPSSRTTVNLLVQWKFSTVMVADEKKTVSYESLWRVT